MFRNGRSFSYIYEPVKVEMYSDEYADTFDTELERWLNSRFLYTVMGEGIRYTVMSKNYEYVISDKYEGKRQNSKYTGKLIGKSMHPADMKQDQIRDWINDSNPGRFKVTEKLTLAGCEDLTELTIITDEEQAGVKGINLRPYAALCDGSEITIYTEDGTNYTLLEKEGNTVSVTYRMVDPWTDPHKASWYSTKTEKYQIE